jgi:competence protein ComEC
VRVRRSGAFRSINGAITAVRARPGHLLLLSATTGLVAGPRVSPPALALIVVALVALAGGKTRALACLAVMLACASLAQTRLAALDQHGAAAAFRAAAPAHVDAILLEPPRARAGGWRAIAEARGVRLLVRGRGARPRWPEGLRIRATGTLRKPGEHDAWLRSRHVALVLEARAARSTGGRRAGIAGAIDRVRDSAVAPITARLPEAESGLLRGMALGDDSALPRADLDALRAAGLGHLVAASGQNIALLALLANALGAAAGIGRRARLLGILALIALYVPLAGGGPSIQRAAVMGTAALVATLASRPAARWYALLLAAALTLALDPACIDHPGWQLSFAATAGIALLAPGTSAALRRRGVPGALADALAITIAATIATAPISAAVFGRVSIVGLAANVLAAPLVAPITWLGMLAAALAQLSPAAGGLPATLAGPPLACLLTLARAAAAVPGAQSDPSPLVVLAGSCAAAALLVRIRDGAPANTRLLTRTLAALASCAVLAALIPHLTAPDPPTPPQPGTLRMSFLDIGQGDATLLQDSAAALLVDSGPPRGPIVAALRRAGVQRLSALAATHAQADHLGGADRVLRALPVELLLDGRDGVREDEGAEMARAARERGVRDFAPHAGERLKLGGLVADVLWPPPRPPGTPPSGDPNDRATVMLVRAAGIRVLLTADAESGVLAQLDLPPVDVLKVSHHGSADEGLPALLVRLRPRVAVIEVGAGNSYGHPVPETIAALRAAGARVLRTDRDGTVVIEARRGRLTIRTAT